MYLFGVAALITQLDFARADECAAIYPTANNVNGSVTPLDICVAAFGLSTMYRCDNGVAYSDLYFTSDDCTGDPISTQVDTSEYTAYCDADPCDVAISTICFEDDAGNCETAGCIVAPLLIDQCVPSDDGEEYDIFYCDSANGLTIGTYTDSECQNLDSAVPYSLFASFLGECFSIESPCDSSGDGGDGSSNDRIDCPTGAIYAVLEDGTEAPYLPLGLCNQYSIYGSMIVDCDDDGVANYQVYAGSDCSGSPFSTEMLELGGDNDTTTFETVCNADVDCTFARFTIISYDEEAGECGGDDEAFESAVLVGSCINNGTASFMISCDDTSVTRATYESLDCTGAALEEVDVMSEFGDERCPGSVVNCYMTEPDFANSDFAPKVVVSQVALVLVVMVGSLFM